MRGTDGAVWTKNATSTGTSWSTWHSLGGQVAPNTGPAVANLSGWVVVQGTDNQFWQRGPGAQMVRLANPSAERLLRHYQPPHLASLVVPEHAHLGEFQQH